MQGDIRKKKSPVKEKKNNEKKILMGQNAEKASFLKFVGFGNEILN